MNDLSNIIIEHDDSKRSRKHNAIKLPDSLAHIILPKYVSYYNECYNNEKKAYREFFKIEKHPNQIKSKAYISSKSNKITILEKLDQIKKILDDLYGLDTNEGEKNNIVKLPKYISLKNHETDSSKFYLIYDKKTIQCNRNTLQGLYYKTTPFSQSLDNFLQNIKQKYSI